MYRVSYYFYRKKYRKMFKYNHLNKVIPKEFFTQPILSYDEYKKIKSKQSKTNLSIMVTFVKELLTKFCVHNRNLTS